MLREVPIGTLDGLFVASLAFEAAAFVSLAVRYRAGGRLLRQQVKWLVLVIVAFLVTQLIAVLLIPLDQPWLSGIARTAVAIIVLFGIPGAMTIAILRHRLYGERATLRSGRVGPPRRHPSRSVLAARSRRLNARRGRWRSGTPANCSARYPCASHRTSH